jgi:hypothetical protein
MHVLDRIIVPPTPKEEELDDDDDDREERPQPKQKPKGRFRILSMGDVASTLRLLNDE